jgi:hydrogenase maturation protease
VRTLLLGLGNPFVRDDAAGILLAREARSRLGHRQELSWAPECSTGGLDLLPLLEGFQRALVFDSIRTRNGRPGDWHRFTARELRGTRHLDSMHDMNFATALELGRRVGMDLPPDEEIHIFAVEILENGEFGHGLSAPLLEVWPDLLEDVMAELSVLLGTSPTPAARPLPRMAESSRA